MSLAVAAPNQTRLRVLASVLTLEAFTVAELCHHAGVEPSQVYRILASLQEDGTLDSSTAPAEEGPPRRHRPAKRYCLREQKDVRERLERELNSFLPDVEGAGENRQLARARQKLRSLSLGLITTSFGRLDLNELEGWQKHFESGLRDADKLLKRSFWESDVDLSEESHPNHPITKARFEFKALESRFRELVGAEYTRRIEARARARWGEIFSKVIARWFLTLNAAVPQELLEGSFKLSAKLIQELKKIERNEHALLTTNHDAVLRYFSSWELDLRDAQSSSGALAALAKNYIAYGKRADIALFWCQHLVSETDDYRLLFNFANVAYLAERPDEAYGSWTKYLSLRWKHRTSCAEQTLVARIRGNDWSRSAYEEAVQMITRKCRASVSAFSETPFEMPEQVAMAPSLYNPLFECGDSESPVISVAEPLAHNRRLYVITTEVERPVVVGFPRFARANLFRCGVSDKVAWTMAGESSHDERIIKVDLFSSSTEEHRIAVHHILTSRLAAAIVSEP